MAIDEAQICLKATNESDKRSLLYMENLTIPAFQVVVIAANMKCNGCKGRFSTIVSKMTGLTEYTIDEHKDEVTVKGDFRARCNFRSRTLKSAPGPPKSLFTCLPV